MQTCRIPRFPSVDWRQGRTTFTAGAPPISDRILAAIVFAIQAQRFLLADIVGRGWCVPGGGLEHGETLEACVRRETLEEAGARLGSLVYLGVFTVARRPLPPLCVPAYRSPVLALGPVGMPGESRGVRLVRPNELSTAYYRWDALLEAVFAYAEQHHTSGYPPAGA
ncbi:MAG: NUDIX domain-containing protein [Armatimonadetes bacterium]|nr:NUDIX domain-containing protein [Armatimonadota bacterium]MDE2207717.1 NUDIX domain-containing protein [Armatimonadota bacterium]